MQTLASRARMRTLTLCMSLVVLLLPYTRSANENRTVTVESGQKFEVMPSDAEVNPGENVTLQCKVLNRHGDCVWLKDNLTLGRISGKYSFEEEPEDGDCSLQIVNASLEEDNASWKCQVTKASRKESPITSSAVNLVVREQPRLPYLKEGAGSLHLGGRFKTIAGDTRSFQCVSRKGNPPASLRWFLGSKGISDLANQTNHTDEEKPRTWKALSVLNYNFTEADNRKELKCVAYHSAYEKTAQEPGTEGLGHRDVAITLEVMSARDEHTTASRDTSTGAQTTASPEDGNVINSQPSTKDQAGTPTITTGEAGEQKQTTSSTEAADVIKTTASTMVEPGAPITASRDDGETTKTTPSTEAGDVIKTTASTMVEPGAPTTTSRDGGEYTQTTASTEAGDVIKATASTMKEPGAPTTTSRDGGETTQTTPSTEAGDVIKTTASTMEETGAPTTTSRDGGENTKTTPSTEAGDDIKTTASTMVDPGAPTTTSREGGENTKTTSSTEAGDVIKTTASKMVEPGAPTTTRRDDGEYTQTTASTEVGDVKTTEATKDGAGALDTTSAGTTHDAGTTAPTRGSISEGVSSTPATRSVPEGGICDENEEKNCKKTPFGRCEVKNGKGVCSCEPPLRLVKENCHLDQTVVKVTFKLKKKSRVTFSNDDDCPPEEVIKEEVEKIFQDKTIISVVNITCWQGEVTLDLVFEKNDDSKIADTVKDTLEKELFDLGEYVLQKNEIKTTLVNHCEMGLSTLGRRLGGLKCIQKNNAYALVCDTARAIRVKIMDVSGFEVELCQDKPCTEYCSEHENKECVHETCLCKRGFHLENDTCVSVCTQNLCKNGGTCKPDAVVDFTCTCPPTFKGPLCEEENKEVRSATLNTVVIGVVLSALLLICLVLTGSIILRLKKKNQILAANCQMWSNDGK